VFRYVGVLDPVPRLPLASLIANPYGHCLKEVSLGQASGTLEFLQQAAGSAAEGLLNATLIDEIWQRVLQRVGAHGLANYHKLLGE
jgi:hypothetical protein